MSKALAACWPKMSHPLVKKKNLMKKTRKKSQFCVTKMKSVKLTRENYFQKTEQILADLYSFQLFTSKYIPLFKSDFGNIVFFFFFLHNLITIVDF